MRSNKKSKKKNKTQKINWVVFNPGFFHPWFITNSYFDDKFDIDFYNANITFQV